MVPDERAPLAGMDDIPDPVAHLANRPIPVARVPVEPSPTRPARNRLERVALVVAFSWVGLATSFLGFRGDLRTVQTAAPLVLWTLLAAASLLLVLRPRARGLPVGVRVLQGIVAVVPLAFVVLAAVTAESQSAPLEKDVACLAASGGIAVAPLLLAAFVLRRSFLSAPAWRGAAIGAVCGLGGTIGVHAHCAVNDLFHVLMAHGLSIGVGALLGAACGALQGRV